MVNAAWVFGVAVLACTAALACSGNEPTAEGAERASSGGASASDAVGSVDSVEGLDAPDEDQALSSFLEGKGYAGWAKESESHRSQGPHGEGVQVFYGPKAAQALRSGAATFPAGAASVKELTSSGVLYGYSVWVKVQDATDGGNGFFWYELIHHAGGGDTVSGNARGSRECVGCHRAGKDYSRSTLPFE